MIKVDELKGTIKSKISEVAKEALANGQGTRSMGGSQGITIGKRYKLLSIDYVTRMLPPQGQNIANFNQMSEEEQFEAGGRKRSWFEFTTDNGALSFSALLGNAEAYSEEFWNGKGDDVQKAKGFKVEELFKPSARTVESFIQNNCDGLLDGKTIECVGIRKWRPEGANFDVTTRVWKLV